MMLVRFVFSCFIAVMHCTTLYAEPQTLGWLESVYLQPSGKKIVAKLDTGARTSSIHATSIEAFKKDGQPWVRFIITGKKASSRKILEERPIVREAKIKEHIGSSQKRYVVELDYCLGGHIYTSEFSLTNRGNFNYRIILGRSTLQGNILVDASRTFTAGRSCKKLTDKKAKAGV